MQGPEVSGFPVANHRLSNSEERLGEAVAAVQLSVSTSASSIRWLRSASEVPNKVRGLRMRRSRRIWRLARGKCFSNLALGVSSLIATAGIKPTGSAAAPGGQILKGHARYRRGRRDLFFLQPGTSNFRKRNRCSAVLLFCFGLARRGCGRIRREGTRLSPCVCADRQRSV